MATNTLNQLTAEQIAKAGRIKRYNYHREEAEKTNLPGGEVMRFTGKVADVSNGVKEVLELLMWDTLRRKDVEWSDAPEHEDQPVLTSYSRGVLTEFARTSLEMLHRDCEHMQQWAYECHTPEGRNDRYKKALFSLKANGQPVPTHSE